jgi:hypothetical protein
VTRRGSVLPIPDDQRIAALIEAWPSFQAAFPLWPRSEWLSTVERILRENYPAASSRDRNVTARSLAPFPLAEHDW